MIAERIRKLLNVKVPTNQKKPETRSFFKRLLFLLETIIKVSSLCIRNLHFTYLDNKKQYTKMFDSVLV